MTDRQKAQKRKLRILWILIPVCVIFLLLLLLNRFELNVEIEGESEYTVEYGSAFSAPKAIAVYRGTIFPIRKEVPVEVEDHYDADVLGDYVITYHSQYKDLTSEASVKVHLVDTTAPTITLAHDPKQLTGIGQPYKEEGFSAMDSYDGDLTASVEHNEENGIVTYTVTDSSGNTATATRTIEYTDLPPVLTLVGESEVRLEALSEYKEEGAAAADDADGDVTAKIKIEGNPDMTKVGENTVTYSVTDSAGHTTTTTRTVHVVDTTPPEITLVSEVEFVKPGTRYEEEGYTAKDSVDGDLTDKVEREEFEDHIVYRVKDSSGNQTEIVREIIYKDVVPPEISLNGDYKVFLLAGTAYEEAGYYAEDDVDGDVTSKVSIEGSVDSGTPGVYKRIYRVADEEGNVAEAVRTIYVYQPQSADVSDTGSKVVYLTFDDGPGPYTEKLLDYLDRFGVKATFFVTNQFPAYQELIRSAASRGHTIGVHTLTHDYAQIYSGEEEFWSDIEKMNDIIQSMTGERTRLMRFPGGSSNTISRRYSDGLMPSLIEMTGRKGYRFCDWNVSADDAVGNTSSSGIASQVIREIQKTDVSIVLQHDIINGSVEAVPEILAWGLANGYTFLPITGQTQMVHNELPN